MRGHSSLILIRKIRYVVTLVLISSRGNGGSGAQTSILIIVNQYFSFQMASQASWPPELPADSPEARSQEFSARRPQPGILAQRPQSGIFSQEPSGGNHERGVIREPSARSPQQGVLSQECSARSPRPGVFSQESSARNRQPGVLSQDFSAGNAVWGHVLGF